MTRGRARRAQTSRPTDACAPSSGRIRPFAAGAFGIALIIFCYHAVTWRSFTSSINAFTEPFSDFVLYYYPMGKAIFRTGLPVAGFLYSPFVAILLSAFPLLGPTAALVLWGVLQVLFVFLYLRLFCRLIPAGRLIQLLFVALTLLSYPLLLNFIAGSVSVFMIVALLGLLVLKERSRTAAAAGLFAFAVGFKFYPIFFLVPFAAGRNTRFLLFLAAACVVSLFVIPGVLLGVGDTLRFYETLSHSFRESEWVVANPHSNYFPHVILRLGGSAGYDMTAHLPLLRWIAYGFAAANVGLIFLIQRARLRQADLWSFQIVFLTLPFVLKTSWPHDFVFLSFTQALLAGRLLGGEKARPWTDIDDERPRVSARREWTHSRRTTVTFLLLIPSIVFSNIIFFNLFGDFSRYGFNGFLFWANLLLLIAIYLQLLPPALGRFRGADVESGTMAP